MKHKQTKFFLILLIAIALKSILWSLLVPLWHTPDEQAHFGHVAFIAEGGELKRHGKYKDMTEEIYTSLDILGTKRDLQGNNKFTFHPEYRLPYSDNLEGPREQEIKNLKLETRQNFAIRESAYYPHFYYQISGKIYKLFYQSNLFIRVFSVRLFWTLISLLVVYLSFRSTELIFPKNPLHSLTIAAMVGFHPMLSFVHSGVTSDTLHNLLFTAVLYFSLSILNSPSWLGFVGLTVSLGLGMINKQQFFIALLIVLPVILFQLIRKPKNTFKYLSILPLSLLLALVLAKNRTLQLLKIFTKGSLPYLQLKSSSNQVLPDHTLLNHLVWTIKHTIREVVPWYWGVFNWLGVVLPKLTNRILNRLALVALVGLVIKVIKTIKRKKLDQTTLGLIFLTWSALAYFSALTIWDWTFMKNNGFSFGIQGRYHFPVILAHMTLLFVGLKQIFNLFPKKLANLLTKALFVFFIGLNLVALHTVASAYYDLSSLNSFITQASQYKPFFAKGSWLVSLLSLFFTSLIVLITKLFKSNEK